MSSAKSWEQKSGQLRLYLLLGRTLGPRDARLNLKSLILSDYRVDSTGFLG